MPSESDAPAKQPAKHWSRRRKVLIFVAALLGCYLVLAYLIVPVLWARYAHRHPSLDDLPRITRTIDDIPGDPLNVALIGTETEVKKIMLAAKWYPADPLTLKSCLGMAEAAVLAQVR